MERFTKLFGNLLVFVYHCFDRIVINGYLSGLSRPEQVAYFFRQVIGVTVVDKNMFVQRTKEYQNWVEAFAGNHDAPVEWAEKGVRKEDYVAPFLRRMERANRYGVYFIFKSMEQGKTFRASVPKFPTKDPNHRILAAQRSRFTHYYFYIRDEVLGPMLEQSLRLQAEEGTRSPAGRERTVSPNYGPLRLIPGSVAQRPRRLSAAPAHRSAHHHRFGALPRNQNP